MNGFLNVFLYFLLFILCLYSYISQFMHQKSEGSLSMLLGACQWGARRHVPKSSFGIKYSTPSNIIFFAVDSGIWNTPTVLIKCLVLG